MKTVSNRSENLNYSLYPLIVDLNVHENSQVSANLDDSCYYSLGHVFYDHKLSLPLPNNQKQKLLFRGQHRIPFSLILPAELPGSFHYNSCGLHARIIYQLEAEVTVPGLLRRNLRSDACELRLLQFPCSTVMPLQVIRELPVSSFVCLAQGSLEVAISLDKNMYSPGDAISIKLAIDSSQCFKDLQSIQVSLQRTLRFGNANTSQNRVEVRILDSRKSKCLNREIAESGNGIIYRRTSLKMPASTPLSMQGRLIECRYELIFRIKVNWCWSVISKISLPIEETHLPEYSNIPSTSIQTTIPIK